MEEGGVAGTIFTATIGYARMRRTKSIGSKDVGALTTRRLVTLTTNIGMIQTSTGIGYFITGMAEFI